MSVQGEHEGGAAKRRRDRRLRMQWRHEQLTLQMALAAALHHSRDVGPVTYNALRSQKTARTEATYDALRSQMHSVAGDTEFFSMFEEELSGRRRPSPLVEVRPQDRVKRHTVDPLRSDTRCSCAAGCRQCDGRITTLGSPDCRAGYCRAQDLLLLVSCPGGSP